jgi:hypothetical protein
MDARIGMGGELWCDASGRAIRGRSPSVRTLAVRLAASTAHSWITRNAHELGLERRAPWPGARQLEELSGWAAQRYPAFFTV